MFTAFYSLLVIAFAIYLLAIITDEFFIISLDQISKRFKLPESVAGASLMAIGSSAPELAIALLALFKGGGEHSDVGIGTIVGSAVFNILIITGVSALARPASVSLPVIARDVLMYASSIGLLLFTFRDGTITMPESFMFLGLYAVYLLILFNWHSAPAAAPVERVPDDKKRGKPLQKKGVYYRITRAIGSVLRFLTGDPEKNYVRAFMVCVFFIAAISWFVVEYAIIFADAVHLPPVIVALTILAGGTSIPDMIASIVVARQGRGEMAIANAVGSNIFDVLIGLGFPWLIAMLINGGNVHVGTDGLITSVLILLGTVLILTVFLITGRVLSRREGWVLISGYGVYVVWAFVTGGS